MAHEIDLETAEKKASQLNTLLYILKDVDFDQLDRQSASDLIELAASLSDPVSSWLIEENAQKRGL